MQLEYAQKSRLNINNEVPEYFERLMEPILRPKLWDSFLKGDKIQITHFI